MRKSIVVALVVSAGLALAACGSSSGTATPGSTTSTTNANQLSSPLWDKAGPVPSKSAKMVCQKEAREDVAANLGIKEKSVSPPTWVKAKHLFSCAYIYPRGKITLFVKELSSEKETTAYFDSVKKKYGVIQELKGLGQGAWILKNNDVVVRKDYKVLLVDVTKIPADFAPAMTRSDVALNIGVAIMGCWTGA
jgi:hypothetical protein